MTLADAVAAMMFSGILLYAIFGGADFGSGVWDLTAGGYKRGAPIRRLIDHAIGPVWEANHVWLIFVLVVFWSSFPIAFAAVMRNLAIPLWLAALGIVARGAGFAFRKVAPTVGWARVAGVVFAASSLLTPFFLGAIAGAAASGRVPLEGGAPLWSTWLNATSILGGVLAIATTTYLSGVLLAAEAHTMGLDELAATMRRRTMIGGAITGAIVTAGIPVLFAEDEVLVSGLLGRALPLVILSAVGGAVSIWLLWRNRLRAARFAAVAAVGSVVLGWGVAQYPWILVGHATIEDAAGARGSLIGMLVAGVLAAFLVVPPLAYLLVLADRNQVGTE